VSLEAREESERREGEKEEEALELAMSKHVCHMYTCNLDPQA
jgi:hypothetical protein